MVDSLHVVFSALALAACSVKETEQTITEKPKVVTEENESTETATVDDSNAENSEYVSNVQVGSMQEKNASIQGTSIPCCVNVL